ncbi:hypothetical protein V144x_24100 [Gimesia aquarii]|uniref:Uncharacterized protein n=1 Tax=Gimesia aquarii TaxID=2527964 RepID=A0A517VVD2_9PLAN|nr:hypothetical protein V144x_24100 [Gimesia aquarii]
MKPSRFFQKPHRLGRSKRQWVIFLLLTSSLSLIWLVILPRAAEIPPLRSDIDFLEQKKIDPTAMFYSDLETIETTVQNIRDFQHENPHALW